MDAQIKGRPRLDPTLRTRIIQIRAQDKDRPPSLDAIINILEKESALLDDNKPRWERLPSRGSVQNVVAAWERLSLEIRLRDLPFDWHRLEDARLPWDASAWVLKCKRWFEVFRIPVARASGLDTQWPPFSNRWALWCWRIHLAAPGLGPFPILHIAAEYTIAEQAFDLLPERPPTRLSGWDSVLEYQPWQSRTAHRVYLEALRLGLVQPVGDLKGVREQEANVRLLWSQPHFDLADLAFGARLWLGSLHSRRRIRKPKRTSRMAKM